jgi:hypothetical protein
MIDDIQVRDPLPKVGLDGIDSSVHQGMDQADIPLACFGVGKVDNSHSRLPLVPAISHCTALLTYHCQTLPLGRLRK